MTQGNSMNHNEFMQGLIKTNPDKWNYTRNVSTMGRKISRQLS
jgi:hypothetical protein